MRGQVKEGRIYPALILTFLLMLCLLELCGLIPRSRRVNGAALM